MPHPNGPAHEMGDYNPRPRGPKNAWGRVPKYALYPGSVTSRTDGDRHHIGPVALAHLYGVDLKDCMVVYEHELDEPWNRGMRERAATLPALRPRRDGKYTLPTDTKE
jgi:hypothetical protein